MSRSNPPRRVFLGLTEIAGYYRALQSGLREHEVASDLVTIFPHHYGYEVTDGQSAEAARMLRLVRRVIPVRPERRTPASVARETLVRLVLLVWAITRYDTFVFGFRNTFLNGWDLPLLRLLGKRVICVFHGSDSRPPYIDRVNGDGLDGAAMIRWVRRRRKVVGRIERWSHAVVVGALTMQLHERPTVNFQQIGAPVTIPDPVPRQPVAGRPLVVVHAPSDLATKGTAAIRSAMAELEAGGRPVVYRELVNVRNDEVLAALASADLLVDQIYSDTFLAGLGAEAAAVGCPAVVAGYELDLLTDLVPAAERPPGFYCHPDDLIETIAAALDDHERRQEVGAEARRFVGAAWSPREVAGRFLTLMGDDVPADWLLDPAEVLAVHGCGLSAEAARNRIGMVIASGGPNALGLGGKVALRRAFVDFSAG